MLSKSAHVDTLHTSIILFSIKQVLFFKILLTELNL
jgi:hypothetical protein